MDDTKKYYLRIFMIVLKVVLIAALFFFIWLFARRPRQSHVTPSDYPSNRDAFIVFQADYKGVGYLIFNEQAPCMGSDNCTWQTTPMQVAYYKTIEGQPTYARWTLPASNTQVLEGGYSFKMAILRDENGNPQWSNGGVGISLGVSLTRSLKSNEPMQKLLIDIPSDRDMSSFRISCADAAGFNVKIGLDDNQFNCNFDQCPKQFISTNGNCLAPKWSNGSQTLYDCDSDDENCKKFWNTDSTAVKWKKYVTGSCKAEYRNSTASTGEKFEFKKRDILKIIFQ